MLHLDRAEWQDYSLSIKGIFHWQNMHLRFCFLIPDKFGVHELQCGHDKIPREGIIRSQWQDDLIWVFFALKTRYFIMHIDCSRWQDKGSGFHSSECQDWTVRTGCTSRQGFRGLLGGSAAASPGFEPEHQGQAPKALYEAYRLGKQVSAASQSMPQGVSRSRWQDCYEPGSSDHYREVYIR